MSTKLLREAICRKGLMVKCFVALIVFCCSVGEAFAQTDTKGTINVNNVLIRTALDQLQREAKIHFVYDEENIDSVVRNVQSEIVGIELRNDYIRESTITKLL